MHLPWRPVYPGAFTDHDGPPISTSLTGDEAARLAVLATRPEGDPPARVLEIGSAHGFSACVMGLAGAQVTTIDPHNQVPGSHDNIIANVRAYAGIDVVIRVGLSHEVMPGLAGPYDLIFVDGDHSGPAVERDVSAALPLLAPGGVLACHDYGEDCCCPAVRKTLDRLYPQTSPSTTPDSITDTLWEIQP